MVDVEKKQEMPPVGGYPPIRTNRIPARKLFTGKQLIGGYLLMTTIAALVFHFTRREYFMKKVEAKSARFAIRPMLLAERDRAYLKQLRRNRDEEADLMKNVEGWKVGTYYGEPVYKLKPPNTLIEPMYQEYYVHAQYKFFTKRAHLDMLS